MGPRELLKSLSSSFGRAGCWVLDWGPSRLRASPSARSRVNTEWGVPAEGTLTLKSIKRVISIQVGA